jgi:translation initiation factor IF-3
VRLISSKGEQLGVMDIRDAMRMAQEENLDLVEIAPNEVPPVARIMDFGRFQYDENKKRRDSKKKQTKVEVKECKFRPKIGDHDFNVRIRRAVKFLAKGDKVKLTVMFRGREHAHPEVAERLLMRAFDAIKDLGKMEMLPKKEGRDMYSVIAPLSEDLRRKAMKLRLEKEGPLNLEDEEIEDEDDELEEEEEVKPKKKTQAEKNVVPPEQIL